MSVIWELFVGDESTYWWRDDRKPAYPNYPGRAKNITCDQAFFFKGKRGTKVLFPWLFLCILLTCMSATLFRTSRLVFLTLSSDLLGDEFRLNERLILRYHMESGSFKTVRRCLDSSIGIPVLVLPNIRILTLFFQTLDFWPYSSKHWNSDPYPSMHWNPDPAYPSKHWNSDPYSSKHWNAYPCLSIHWNSDPYFSNKRFTFFTATTSYVRLQHYIQF